MNKQFRNTRLQHLAREYTDVLREPLGERAVSVVLFGSVWTTWTCRREFTICGGHFKRKKTVLKGKGVLTTARSSNYGGQRP